MRNRRTLPPGVTLRKVDPQDNLTAYEVVLSGRSIGFVWSRRGFSYRGTEGWNRGIRLQDFHPTEWFCGPSLYEKRWCYDRSGGIAILIDKLCEKRGGRKP